MQRFYIDYEFLLHSKMLNRKEFKWCTFQQNLACLAEIQRRYTFQWGGELLIKKLISLTFRDVDLLKSYWIEPKKCSA